MRIIEKAKDKSEVVVLEEELKIVQGRCCTYL